MNWKHEINTLLDHTELQDDPRAAIMTRASLESFRDVSRPVLHSREATIERFEMLEPRVTAQVSQYLTRLDGFSEQPDDDYYVRLYACSALVQTAMRPIWSKIVDEVRDDLCYAMARAMMVGIELGRRT